MPFKSKNASFYQDRLGTNIGKALKKSERCVFLQSGELSSEEFVKALRVSEADGYTMTYEAFEGAREKQETPFS
jgi:hypothetical protein